MSKNEIVNFIIGLLLFLLSVCLLLLPTFKVTNIKNVFLTIFSLYSSLKLIGFIFVYKDKDYENLYTTIASIICLIFTCFFKITTKNLCLILMIWMGLMSLIKLKKADYYHDHDNKMWILSLIMLFIFIASGLLTGINLLYEKEVQILVIGYFFLINSIFDIINPVLTYLNRGVK